MSDITFSRGFDDGLLSEGVSTAKRLAAPLQILCQSPIEIQFGAAFLFLAKLIGKDCAIITKDALEYRDFALVPQQQIGKYRVDFVVAYVKPGSPQMEAIVECDGREFHHSTREQIERDRARDKDLEGLGHKVFRFPGTQLDSDPFGAAGDVLLWLLRESQSK